MSDYCPYCGSQLAQDDAFCTNCGKQVEKPDVQTSNPVQQENNVIQHPQQNNVNEINPDYALSVYFQYLNKLDTAATVWLVIGILQIVIGVFTLIFCYGVVPIILGIWNITQSSKTRNSVRYLRSTSKGAVNYIDSNGSGVAALIINLILGAFIGVIAAAVDLSAQSYGKNNRRMIWFVEQNGWPGGIFQR